MFDSLPFLPHQQRWRQQLYPLPVVATLIARDEVAGQRYLLIKRLKDPYAGQWALVGGKWDFGETLAGAATREVKEETGLETTFVALRGLVNERLAPRGSDGEGAHFLIFVCQVVATAGEAHEQSEGKVAWFTLAEIDALHAAGLIVPSDYAMIRQFADSGESLTHYEVEMIAGDRSTAGQVVTLARFEEMGESGNELHSTK